jgi:predicted transcriptional regulator
MCASFGHRGADGDERLERAIVLLLLADGRAQARSRAELAAELGADPPALERALDSLMRAGVVDLAGADARASRPARRIDELGLIGI